MPALALRYAVFHLGVDCAIVGTRSAAHLIAAIEACERGPLTDEERGAIEVALDRCAAGWPGLV
jgi:aryl-alcohol dehydrogenase-like predicted oxidoreductase